MPKSPREATPWPGHGVYAVTPERWSGPDLAAAVATAVAHGVRAVQYRDKSADGRRRRRDAEALLAICRRHEVPFIVNDDVSLALAIGADGVHLGRDDAPYAAARSRLGDTAIIGISCYDDTDRALAAANEGADYVAFGSFFLSRTKPGAVRATTDLVTAVRTELEIPIVAIGGITADNAPALLDSGVNLIAVVNALFGTADIGPAAHRLAGLFS